MPSELVALCFGADDPSLLARFWGELLGWQVAGPTPAGIDLLPSDDTGFRIRFRRTQAPKLSQNQMHLDLTSTSPADQRQTVQRALDLGARPADVGQRPGEPHVVLADPEGNEFCVVEPDNRFLADCGFLGAVACDGSQAVGYFWTQALDWPMVWDDDEQTAIRSRHGGPKISWGGPPVNPKNGPNRLHFLLAADGAELQAELDRLVGLGAARPDGPPEQDGSVLLTDPDGNEFRVQAGR